MVRVQQVNDSPEFLQKVTAVVLFGSYLTDKGKLGDLDIAVDTAYRKVYPDGQKGAACIEHWRASGRKSSYEFEYFHWPEHQVRLHLKNRKRTISLHQLYEVQQFIARSADFRFEVLLGDRGAIIANSRSEM
jgi:hypothetical protein